MKTLNIIILVFILVGCSKKEEEVKPFVDTRVMVAVQYSFYYKTSDQLQYWNEARVYNLHTGDDFKLEIYNDRKSLIFDGHDTCKITFKQRSFDTLYIICRIGGRIIYKGQGDRHKIYAKL